MSTDASLFTPLFEIAVLVGPFLLAMGVARAVRGKDYDLFAEAA